MDADMTEPGVYWNSAFAWLVGYAVNDAAIPELKAASLPGGCAVSWPLRSAPFALYSTTNLDPSVTWALVTNRPAVSNRMCSVALPKTSGSGFYRLQAP